MQMLKNTTVPLLVRHAEYFTDEKLFGKFRDFYVQMQYSMILNRQRKWP